MGIGRYFLHDWFTAHEFNNMEQEIEHHKSRAEDLGLRIRELEKDLGYVALLARSLAEACVRRGVLSREELAATLSEVDLADGVKDGRLSPRAARAELSAGNMCACGHVNAAHLPNCLYCGQSLV